MTAGQIVSMVLSIIFFVFLLTALIYAIINLVSYRKNQKLKYIMIKSLAQSFVIMLILQFLHFAVQFVAYDIYMRWWTGFILGFDASLVAWSLIILGVVLFINKKKSGYKNKE